MSKEVKISPEVHRLLGLIKFYAGLNLKDVADDLLKEALTSPEILRKVLMNFLLDRKKVDFVIRKVKEEAV